MIKLIDLLYENSSIAFDKIDKLPKGKIFDDAKNIENVFKKSKHTWNEVINAYEQNKDTGELTTVDLNDIQITQPNIQANKAKQMVKDINNLPTINVVEFNNGEKVIYDGHHRLIANWAVNNNEIEVNLIKAPLSN